MEQKNNTVDEPSNRMPDMGEAADASAVDFDLFPSMDKSKTVAVKDKAKPDVPPPSNNPQQTVWYEKPFLKGQKNNPSMSRIKQKVVKVYDLGDAKDIVEYNDLMNKSINEQENISNLKTVQLQFSTQSDTFKALVIYDILEFKNPLD